MKNFDKKNRIIVLTICILFCYAMIAYRLVDLSYINRQIYLAEIEKTHKFKQFLYAKRGNILDRNGEILASSVNYIELGVDAFAANPKKDAIKIEKLSEILHIEHDDLMKKFVRRKFTTDNKIKKIRWVKIAAIYNEGTYENIKNLKIKGLSIVRKERRHYVNGNIFCHITGYVNKENEAVCGVEHFMNFYLTGQNGFFEAEKDGKQNELMQYRSSIIEPINGCDVVLSIDSRIQNISHEEILNIVKEYSPKCACIIVSNVENGDILGLVNYPDYDPNEYWLSGFDKMRNRSVSDVYEPGSVFKIVTASLALEHGISNEDTMFDCAKSTFFYKNREVSLPVDSHAFGKLIMTDVLRKSSNRGVAIMAMMLGEKKFYEGVCSFGFGEKSGYGFDSEVNGLLNPISKWDGLTISRMPIGHSISVTPMQMHFAIAVLASDGTLFSPQLFKEIRSGNEKIVQFGAKIRRTVVSRQTVVRMRKMLFKATNKPLHNNINYCGKTGTTQKFVDGQYSHNRHISGFSGFFPVEDPKIVITVIVDDAHVDTGIAWGVRVSEPAFVRIANKIIDCFGM